MTYRSSTPSRIWRPHIPRRKVRVRRATCLLLPLLAIAACAARIGDASVNARIHYYGQRLGGPSTYPAYARLGIAYAEKARITGRTAHYLDAAAYLDRSLAMQRNYEALLGLAGVSLALHRFPEALAYAQESVATSPGDPTAQGALFDAELGLGNDCEATKILNHMPEQSFGRLVRLAALREYHGEGAAALRDVEQACALLETNPTPAPVTTRAWCGVRMGALYLASCDAEKARTQYDHALATLPRYAFAQEHLAELEVAEGKTDEAMRRYQDLLATAPEPRYRLQLAVLYDTAGRPDDAAEQRTLARAELLHRAAQDVRDAWHELAMLEAESPATVGEALRWAEKDWRNREDAHAADALAWALFRHGDVGKAEASVDRALAPGGASPTILLHAAIIRRGTGHADDARALFARALACPAALTPAERRLAEQASP
jgi:tetratricopeptide (TPR) repeat protein